MACRWRPSTSDQAWSGASTRALSAAAAEQTAQAQALNPEATEEPGATEQTAAEATEVPQGQAQETPAGSEETPAAGATEESSAPDLSGNASLDTEGLIALLPAADQVPAALTEEVDVTRTQEEVVEALGGGRPAETNLTDWGWSGNTERQFSVADPEAADTAGTTYLAVSVHGFGSPEGATEALPFFSDILVNTAGYSEAEAPDLGDSTRMLTMTDETGATNVTLYIQQGSVLYRILGFSPEGDPTQDVIDVATATLGN